MENLAARKIINDLLEDPNLYQQLSEQEGQVWGEKFSNQERSQLITADQEAAKKLKLNRNHLELIAVLKKHKLVPQVGLSLGCGQGRAERRLMERKVCTKFHGIDVAAEALTVARNQAAQHQLDITYEQADLNYVVLKEQTYDLVVAQTCLHHVLRLENLADQIFKSLKPGGVLWIHDYIGETQFQYSDERMEWANAIMDTLPERLRYDTIGNRLLKGIKRKPPGTLVSPFEAIRSGEIMSIFLQRFEVVEKSEFNSILHLVCQRGTRSSYLASEDGQVVFELIVLLDKMLIDKGILPPAGGQYLLRPKS